MRRTLMDEIYDLSPGSQWFLRYGLGDGCCATHRQQCDKIGLWDICCMLTTMWREHISKSRHVTKFVFGDKSWMFAVRHFWDMFIMWFGWSLSTCRWLVHEQTS